MEKTSAKKSEKAPQVTRRGKSAVVGGVSGATKSGKRRVKDTESSESTDTASSPSPPHTLTPHTPPTGHDHTPTHHTLTQPPAHNTQATGGAMMQGDVTTTDTSESVDSLECEQPPAVSMAPETVETQQTIEDPHVETSSGEG